MTFESAVFDWCWVNKANGDQQVADRVLSQKEADTLHEIGIELRENKGVLPEGRDRHYRNLLFGGAQYFEAVFTLPTD